MNRLSTHSAAARHNPLFARHRPLPAIEWEELPSLADALRLREYSTTTGPVWNSTEPMPLHMRDTAPEAEPFVEVLAGLHVREISGEEVFRHFFGDAAGH
jgi:hypothetical protein